MAIDFEKLGRTIYEAFRGTSEDKQPSDEPETKQTENISEDGNSQKQTEVKEDKVDPRDIKIKELEQLLLEKNNLLTERDGQINALKELTKTEPPQSTELTLKELIEKGEL